MSGDRDILFDGFPVSKGGSAETPRIILYSHARMLRNLDGRLFPGRAEASDLSGVRGEVWRAARCLNSFAHGWAFEGERTSTAEATALVQGGYAEEGWASRPMAGVMVSGIRDVSLVANADDHLSINAFRPGIAVRDAIGVAEDVAHGLSQGVVYSRHPQIGYLTANLSDAGLGLRVSIALHLPVLRMSGRIRSIARGLDALGFVITNSFGSMGKLEDDILKVWRICHADDDLDTVVRLLEEAAEETRCFEEDARAQMLGLAPEDLFDRVGRCYGLLSQVHRLSELEALRFFSGLRLGIDLGMFKSLDHELVDRLEQECATICLMADAPKEASLRDAEISRARHVKRTLDLLR